MKKLVCAVGWVALVAGCSDAIEDESASAEEAEVIGSDGPDWSALERTLGLEKNHVAAPAERRPRSALEAGPCFKAFAEKAASDPSLRWNLRAYTKGAAFFEMEADGTTPKGPIQCVDLDAKVTMFDGTTSEGTFAMNGLVLDAIVRYDLGALQGVGVAPNQDRFIVFARGRFTASLPPSAAMAENTQLGARGSFEHPANMNGIVTEVVIGGTPISPALAQLLYFQGKADGDNMEIKTDRIGHFLRHHEPTAEQPNKRRIDFENASAWYSFGDTAADFFGFESNTHWSLSCRRPAGFGRYECHGEGPDFGPP